MIEEQKLVSRLLAGDTEAEEVFFSRFRPRLVRACAYFLGTQDSDAEDIVQDAFMVALPKLPLYVFHAPIYAWLRQICLRLCYARMRARGRALVTMEADLELMMQRMAQDRVDSQGLEEQKQERLIVLRESKKLLKPVSLKMIELRDVQGLSYLHISRELHIPIGTVMSRLARARGQLRLLVADELAKTPSDILPARTPTHRRGGAE